MQVLHNSRIGDFTRGGQVIIHFMRMIGQVIHKFFSAIVVLYVVMSLYKSQGKTAERVLVDAPVQDAHMLNHHAFLVGVSRHRESVTFFTDDKAELAKRIVQNPGDKTSALEALGEERADRLRSTVELISRAFGSSSRPSEPSPVESIMDSIRQSPELARDRQRLPPHVAALLNREPTPAQEVDVPMRDSERSIGL